MAELASMLRELHRWTPPPEVLRSLRERPGQDDQDPVGIVGVDAVPLPLSKALALVDPLKEVPHVDADVVDEAVDRMKALAHHDLPTGEHLIHGDVYLGNVLVDDDRITALIDFEFARLAPPDLELISFVRALDAERRLGIGRPPLLAWLAADYPDLFADPYLDEKLWLYALAFTMRGILFWPPDLAEDAGLDPSHPLHTLRRLVHEPLPR
jgi:hypothetical protein